ncbi:MAG: long-chain fatty acid--CoA ligase [Roseofilum sp. SBFL]|uniref:class I adenylate-forming enzyme family protein n=1 Tax=unclassified Roseofilum TaxID=2620099 RepID=UPI001B2EFBD7|nr:MULTISPECIES: long-chain fatty acid--CoA ligase [unclassified Roseofilum]MBP0011664.1 long-chain fatty acid--CoA ligase [Roseofilum sp. SID3]MBP0025831.1 long-chain fatty acid--CoA ligase [Roseofilum sp. SID2]MBP0040031.1 long-chain fatty acid--CoA ligase [Roseofilum sp. SID1]MBP0043970.1 long-chain fatty acid--CoA ligase [Roseofilum sp. SBFL]
MNITEHLERDHKIFPQRVALRFEGQEFTYQHLDELVNRMANGLKHLGVEKGDRVALFLPNIPEFVVAYLGSLKIGAVVVSLNVMLKQDEVLFILNDCEAKAIVTTQDLRVQIAADDLAHLQHILIAEGKAEEDVSLTRLLARMSPHAKALSMQIQDPAAILYTSGTTGLPKGATLSHGNVVSNMHSVKHNCQIQPHDKLLLYLPLFHCFGQNFILNGGLNAAATIVLQRRFDPEKLVETVQYEGITMFFGVPTVFAKLLDMQLPPLALRTIRYYFSAAAVLPAELTKRWQEQYGQWVHEGYGLTETSPFSCYNHDWHYKLGSIGMPIDNVEMQVVDAKGETLPPGEVGELVIRGPNVMLGYFNNPEETAKVLKDGWFHSGDLGHMDEDGYFYIVDRLKDMINRSGFKIYPAEVERVLYQHSDVMEAAVYGAPHPTKGEVVKAKVRLKAGRSLKAKALQAFCADRMAKYKVPSSISFVDSLPKNATGKILKRVLREEELALKKK